eukprot:TRINITY_DN5070_c0_g1_i4.p1 TRINITY_DN5070_c0_g1~~TRINITY_DN5070_c0_g1_i4.p1  ORF type:complete len:552 (-),score=75.32 TRINITY_DN5070_c0_g1_i4:208-1863(-)
MEEQNDYSETQLEIPQRLLCPITEELMEDPVMLVETGNVYEKSAIQKWLTLSKTDPLTSVQIKKEDLAPVHVLRSECMEYREKMEKEKVEEGQSPLVTKATELDSATKLLKEKQKEMKLLQNQVKQIEDDLMESGKEFQKNYRNFVGVCIQLKNANTELEKVCVASLLTTSADVIREKMEAYEKSHQEIVDEGAKVKRWVQNLLQIKDRQEQQKNILNPVKTEEKKLQEEVDKKQKELAQLTGQKAPRKEYKKKNPSDPNIQEFKKKNPSNPNFQEFKKEFKNNRPQKEKKIKQKQNYQSPNDDSDRQSSSSSNSYQRPKNFPPKQYQGHQPQNVRSKGQSSQQEFQGNSQRQFQQRSPREQGSSNRGGHRPPPPPPSIQQQEELDFQSLLDKISSGVVINANVQISEDTDRVVCHVHKPLFITGLHVTKIKANKGKHSHINLVFEGKENITIRDSSFTRVGLSFDGINHKSGQVVQIENSSILSSSGNGLSFSGSNGRMRGCTLQNYHLFGVQLANSTVLYEDIQFNKNVEKQVDVGIRGEWIKIQPNNT